MVNQAHVRPLTCTFCAKSDHPSVYALTWLTRTVGHTGSSSLALVRHKVSFRSKDRSAIVKWAGPTIRLKRGVQCPQCRWKRASLADAVCEREQLFKPVSFFLNNRGGTKNRDNLLHADGGMPAALKCLHGLETFCLHAAGPTIGLCLTFLARSKDQSRTFFKQDQSRT
jgi:hypothetical protein